MSIGIVPGMKVIARSTLSGELFRRAVSGEVDGLDFRVVWVCSEDEWTTAQVEGREAEGVPWPAEDVRSAS